MRIAIDLLGLWLLRHRVYGANSTHPTVPLVTSWTSIVGNHRGQSRKMPRTRIYHMYHSGTVSRRCCSLQYRDNNKKYHSFHGLIDRYWDGCINGVSLRQKPEAFPWLQVEKFLIWTDQNLGQLIREYSFQGPAPKLPQVQFQRQTHLNRPRWLIVPTSSVPTLAPSWQIPRTYVAWRLLA